MLFFLWNKAFSYLNIAGNSERNFSSKPPKIRRFQIEISSSSKFQVVKWVNAARSGTGSKEMDLDFEIYRPPKISNRLEPSLYQAKTDEWRPSVDYRFRLDDIEGQFTPAEYFRHRLATSGKEIRMIQKLELRWKRNFELFTKSAIKVQAAYRGMVERRYFNSIKAQLQADLKLKRITARAIEEFYSEQYATAIKVCHSSDQITVPLLEIELKSHYRLKNWDFCIKTSNKLIGE